jgi:transcription elongation factor GreA
MKTDFRTARPIIQIPPIPFTAEAYQAMEQERQKLLALREEVLVRLKVAREMGDLSENGAYKYAKFELGNIGRRLRELNHLLEHGVVTEKKSHNGHIDFGSQVTVESGEKQLTFTLVSEYESNPTRQKLSIQSPLGSALMGRQVGETVTVPTPSGEMHYKILQVQ